MAHEVESMFSARLTPWHRLGTVTEDVLTAKEAIVAAGLDWEVEKREIFRKRATVTDDGVTESYEVIPDRFELVRTSDEQMMTIVSDVYKPFQNSGAFDFMDTLVDDGKAKYETAGSLRGGRVVFVTMKTPTHIQLPGDDKVETYLLLRTTHDGSGRISVHVVTVRVVCMNTLTWAINGAKSSWGVTHTADVATKIHQARESLGLTFKYDEAFEAEALRLVDIKVSDRKIQAFLESALRDRPGKEAEVKAAMENYKTSPTVGPDLVGTGWGAINGISEYFEHVKDNKSGQALFMRVIDGEQAKIRTNLKTMLLTK
jgi:phage/plasmid-like protein (TIGR03299 family)